ncbi:glycine zipper 2TM domain-containing protein [Cupriavidus pauculus]|uniref:glycine zipper 2TM domain-containing protein n=1 Tax=Cupriavidus pauculus TaxID=82633 RepID=UPI001EE2352D|nr:glycine zipper 2TM domain-containing protein [Cupriavidus pauculus]GJG93167.1 glycine zipper 2TM domain-containing protein [Cupriavidus pauculus]
MSGPETLPSLPSQRRLHPLVGAAAVAVVVASLTAVAAVTGVLPITKANQGPATEASYNAPQGPAPVTAETAPPGSTTRPPAYDAQQARNTAPPPPQVQAQAQPQEKPAAQPSHTAGHVTGVQVVEAEKPTSGLGALGGAVVGGLVGNQIGNGNGRILGTVAGAAAGGFGGNYAEKKLNTNKSYRVSVKMDDGSRRTFTYQNPPGVEVGQRVHLERGVLVTG